MHHTFNRMASVQQILRMYIVCGLLKQRFPILRQLRMDLARAQRVVLVCCVLHIMAEYFKDDVPTRGWVPAHLLDDADVNDVDDDRRNAQVVQGHRDTYANIFYQAYLQSRRGY